MNVAIIAFMSRIYANKQLNINYGIVDVNVFHMLLFHSISIPFQLISVHVAFHRAFGIKSGVCALQADPKDQNISNARILSRKEKPNNAAIYNDNKMIEEKRFCVVR